MAGSPRAYAASPKRFLALALFSAIAFLWAGTWLAFAPVADLAATRFDVSLSAVNAVAACFLWLYIPGSALCLFITDSYGVRACLLVAASVNTACVAVRWLALATPSLSPHTQYAINLLAQARVRGC